MLLRLMVSIINTKGTVPFLYINPRDCESRGLMLLVIAYPYIVPWCAEGSPGDVHPAGAGEELVGVFTMAKEVDQRLEMLRVLGADVGSLAKQMLGTSDTANKGVDAGVAEAAVDDDGTADGLAGRLQ